MKVLKVLKGLKGLNVGNSDFSKNVSTIPIFSPAANQSVLNE